MILTLIILATLIVGVLLGWLLLPAVLSAIEKRRKFDAYKAKLLVKQKKLEIRNSKEFKKRLSEALRLIKEEAAEEKRNIKIAFHCNCRTDKELAEELNNRNFETYETGDNTLKISW